MRNSNIALGVTLALAFACKPPEQGATGSKEDAFAAGDIKADCADCKADDLRSAHQQLGIATRFLKQGDFWQVAFRPAKGYSSFGGNGKARTAGGEIEGAGGAPTLNDLPGWAPGPEEGGSASRYERGNAKDLFVIDFAVSGTHKEVRGKYRRTVAEITVNQATTDNLLAGLVTTDALDDGTQQIVLTMDDLLFPVRKKYITEDYPNGRTIEITPANRVRATSDAFPADVPDAALAQTATGTLPAAQQRSDAAALVSAAGTLETQADALEAAAASSSDPAVKLDKNGEADRLRRTAAAKRDAADRLLSLWKVADKAAEATLIPADWETRTYRHFVFENQKRQFYWAAGEMWPFYSITEKGEALVIKVQGQ